MKKRTVEEETPSGLDQSGHFLIASGFVHTMGGMHDLTGPFQRSEGQQDGSLGQATA